MKNFQNGNLLYRCRWQERRFSLRHRSEEFITNSCFRNKMDASSKKHSNSEISFPGKNDRNHLCMDLLLQWWGHSFGSLSLHLIKETIFDGVVEESVFIKRCKLEVRCKLHHAVILAEQAPYTLLITENYDTGRKFRKKENVLSFPSTKCVDINAKLISVLCKSEVPLYLKMQTLSIF